VRVVLRNKHAQFGLTLLDELFQVFMAGVKYKATVSADASGLLSLTLFLDLQFIQVDLGDKLIVASAV